MSSERRAVGGHHDDIHNLLLAFGVVVVAAIIVKGFRSATRVKLETLKTRFRDHTIEIFKRHGMESIGYWVPQDGPEAKTTLIYIISHASREQAKKNWAEFQADSEWKKVAADSEKEGKILAKPPESKFLEPVDFSMLK